MFDSASTPRFTIALAGPHSDAFVKTIHATKTFNIHTSITVNPSTDLIRPSVLAIAGEAPSLSETDIDQILRRKTVLALFRPSRALLETIHRTTSTPIDIPNLQLADGLPLVIYMVNDVVHIAPNNINNAADVERVVASALGEDNGAPRKGSFTVSLTNIDPAERATKSIIRAMIAAQGVSTYSSSLTPPLGVIGFKKCTLDNTAHISLTTLPWSSDGHANVATSDKSLIQRYNLNWYTDVYSYATSADCRGVSCYDFTEAGGEVFTLTIERGNLRRAQDSPPRYFGPVSGVCSYYFVDWNQTGTHSDSLKMVAYQPSGEDSNNSTKHNYSINFEQDMQMLEDNGNSRTTFRAQYSNGFSLDKFQLHAVPASAGVDYSVDYKDFYDHWADPKFQSSTWWDTGVYEKNSSNYWVVRPLPADNLPIHGLTLFSSSVGKYDLLCKWKTEYIGFKSSAWRTSDEDETGHMQCRRTVYYNQEGYKWPLDLTWPRP